MGSFDVNVRRRADGTLAQEVPDIFEVIVMRSYQATNPNQLSYQSEPLGQFLRRNWIGLMPAIGMNMCDLTWPG